MRTITTLLILLAALCSQGQEAFKSRSLNTEDGLPSNYIINMVQDPRGYIWMATSDGLCRYDGYSFDVLRHSDTGNDSLLLSNRLPGALPLLLPGNLGALVRTVEFGGSLTRGFPLWAAVALNTAVLLTIVLFGWRLVRHRNLKE